MTTEEFYFSLGLISGFVPLAVLIAVYYVRARRRVASIKASIVNYQQATKTVNEACERVYDKNSSRPV